ncbi:MAG: response regulator receiver protein [Bacteroidetes bacterium]|nr:response regulator receiver protein [Bacteroidota bacterium]
MFTQTMKKDLVFFLIDDDKDDIEIFDLALKQTDCLVKLVSANNGDDAIKKLQADDRFIPDYIFLDLDMPIMNGKICFEEIKKIKHLNKVPVYIYTTSQNPLDELKYLLSGATLFFFKPSYIKELVTFLRGIIDNTNH